MKYSIYSLNTGRIEKTISCSAGDLHLQYDDISHGYIHGGVSDTEYYVEDGVPVAMPTTPSEHHVFDYTLKQWVDPRTPATEWPIVRAERDRSLQASDWTQLPDVPLATKEIWAVYRQALRDITEQEDPFNIQWPSLP